ncbi:spiroplasma phage ORF1-like family protein [Spiroplasma endosymbiont of Colias croceus]|uniref:spiroplasma phage ORF1-like family protein n=1 Tax=Spiroplasma endosymbiont of Colias croceus TaxID=3066310 RepID=UPI0030D0704A
MRKIYNLIIVMFCTFFSTFQIPQIQTVVSSDFIKSNNLKANSGINEEDFINTMFLKSSFFENWSDTNYFINPTLKNSKPLTYNQNWYMDYIKDSFSTGISVNRPSDKFMNLYKNYVNIIDKYFGNVIYNSSSYTGEYLYSHLKEPSYNKSLFLDIIVSGMTMKLEFYPNGVFDEFQGWNNTQLHNFANTVDTQLNNFTYYPARLPFKDYSATNNYVGNNYLASEMRDGGKLVAEKNNIQQSAINFLNDYSDVIIQELMRVQNGGSPNYENIDTNGTEKIIFSFEVVNDNDEKYNILKENYQMTLTINDQKIIRAGTLHFLNKKGNNYQADRLNFTFNFVQNDQNKYVTQIETFSYDGHGTKTTYENITGNLNLQEFLTQFFSNALIPIFQNRSKFIESGYLDNLTYDSVLINFFGLKDIQFQNLLTDNNNKPITEWNNLIKNILVISKGFYRDYIRAIFDMDNNTYVQGYNHEYGLLCNNGFKIYPQYFYYSDKYKNLKVSLYSAYQNRFYKTKYGYNFNYDYSVSKDFNTTDKDKYIFYKSDEIDLKLKYLFKFQKLDSRTVGYNVFTLSAQPDGNMYRYFDFNFGIYNWQEITKDGLYPDGQWWNQGYESCAWYDLFCHLKNGAIWIVNTIPGVKQANELAFGVGAILKDTVNFFNQLFDVWKFSPALYNTVTNLFVMIVFMKLVRLI